MLITIENLHFCYQQIIKTCVKYGSRVIIFVSNDTDAVCAARILTCLFKSDNIQYFVIPVLSFSQLDKEFEEMKEKKNVRSLIFLNCGGQLDLTEKWFCEAETKIKCYVFDSHRPIHHNNVNSHKKVIVIDDMCSKLEECPLPEDIVELIESDEEPEPQVSEEESEENPEEEPEKAAGEKRMKAREKREEARTIQRMRRAKIEAYYAGTFYGKSVAYLVYAVTQQLNKEVLDYAWWWIIGLSYQYLHSKISKIMYDESIVEVQREILRLTKFKEAKSTSSSINKEVGTIVASQELQFMLLRHWNLFDSAYYSNYVASKLELWKEPGRRELNRFFATIGIPLEEAKQDYQHMKADIRSSLREKTCHVASKFNMEEIAYFSFIKQYDRKTQLSASDMAYCITSLLENPSNINLSKVTKSKEPGEDTKSPEEIKEIVNEINDNVLKDNFWAAYEALNDKNVEDHINLGIKLAIDMQKAIVNEGTSLIEKKKIYPSQGFRYAIMLSLQEAKFFQYPLALQKLGLFIMEALSESRKQIPEKPLVLCALNSVTNLFLVVGVMGPNKMVELQKNSFGHKFREAATAAGARMKHDGFETSIIEINKDDFQGFIDELCSTSL